MDIKIKTVGLTPEETKKIELAKQHIYRAVNSNKFKDFILNFYWYRPVCSGYLWWRKCSKFKVNSFVGLDGKNIGYTGARLYNEVMSGAETLSPEVDNEADIFIEIDRGNNRRVLGYTYPATNKQYIYSYFFKTGTVQDLAGNIFHEFLHKQGFVHDYKRTYSRQFSVPYALGYFVRDFKGE